MVDGIATILGAGLGVVFGGAASKFADKLQTHVTPGILYDIGVGEWRFLEGTTYKLTRNSWFPTKIARHVDNVVRDGAHAMSAVLTIAETNDIRAIGNSVVGNDAPVIKRRS